MSKEKGNRLYHYLDRYIGIPIVFLLGIFKRKNNLPTRIDRIAIVSIVSIGDNVLMSASISDIRKTFPNVEITVFTGSTNYELVKLIDGIDKIVKLELSSLLRSHKLIKQVGQVDVLLDFGSWTRLSSIFSWIVKAEYKIGFYSDHQHRHYIYNQSVNHSKNKHELDNYRDLTHSIVRETVSKPQINIVSSEKVEKMISRKNCVVHAWPGGYKSYMKEWDNHNWVDLIENIHNDFDLIFLTGAPGDSKKSNELYHLINKRNIKNVKNIAGELKLSETVFLISKSQMVFSVNTGIAHVAAALDIPQICLHGPTNVNRWKPYSEKSIPVTPNKGNFGYLHFGNEYHLAKENCMDNITVESVVNEYNKISRE